MGLNNKLGMKERLDGSLMIIKEITGLKTYYIGMGGTLGASFVLGLYVNSVPLKFFFLINAFVTLMVLSYD